MKKDKQQLELERSIERMQKENKLTFSVLSAKSEESGLFLFFIACFSSAVSSFLSIMVTDKLIFSLSCFLLIIGAVVSGFWGKKLIGRIVFLLSVITFCVAFFHDKNMLMDMLPHTIFLIFIYFIGLIQFQIFIARRSKIANKSI